MKPTSPAPDLLSNTDIDILVKCAIQCGLDDPETRRSIIERFEVDIRGALPINKSTPYEVLQGDIRTLQDLPTRAALDRWLDAIADIAERRTPLQVPLLRRYRHVRHLVMAGLAGPEPEPWVHSDMARARKRLSDFGTADHPAKSPVIVDEFTAGDGGRLLETLTHFLGGPESELLWVHLLARGRWVRRPSQTAHFDSTDLQGLRPSDVVAQLGAVKSRVTVLTIDLGPVSDYTSVSADLRQQVAESVKQLGPAHSLKFLAIGPDLTRRLVECVNRSTEALTTEFLAGAFEGPEVLCMRQGVVIARVSSRIISERTPDDTPLIVAYLRAVRRRLSAPHRVGIDDADGFSDLDETYVPLRATIVGDRGRSEETRDAMRRAHVVFTGEPGAGKSMTVRHLAMQLAKAHLLGQSFHDELPADLLPVFVDLSMLTDDVPRSGPGLLSYAFEQMVTEDRRAPLPSRIADRALEQGRLVLVCDGLDEVVPSIAGREWARVLTDLARTQCANCRVWVTCRSDAARLDDILGPPFERAHIEPLDASRSEVLITKWFRARSPSTESVAHMASRVVDALADHPTLADHATSPLMLALVCQVFLRRAALPYDHADVYREWVLHSLSDRNGQERLPGVRLPARRLLLMDLAWHWWQEASNDRESGGNRPAALAEEQCLAQVIETAGRYQFMGPFPPTGRRKWAQQVVDFFIQQAGILLRDRISPVTDDGLLTFRHRSVGEYLVACALLNDEARRSAARRDHLLDDAWRRVWRFLLAIGARQDDPSAARHVLTCLVEHVERGDASTHQRALAGSLVADSLSSMRRDGSNPSLLKDLGQLQEAMFAHPIGHDSPPADRVRFWRSQGEANAIAKSQSRWVWLEAAKFWYGVAQGDVESGIPGRWLRSTGFYISRWPVLVGEYWRFVEDDGYIREALWSSEGWAWRSRRAFVEPREWYRQRHDCPTVPVTGVSYHEAYAYVSWLSQCGETPPNTRASIPTEVMWERAARGPDAETRTWRYPWGATDVSDYRNGEEQMLGPAPLGTFPGGRSPDGIWMMSGDVAEWCASVGLDGEISTIPSLRGGCWLDSPLDLRLDRRDLQAPTIRNRAVGIRCAALLTPDEARS